MLTTLTVHRPQQDQITRGWPRCCQRAYPPDEYSEKQKRAAKWVNYSLFPWYRPCNKCAYDITRRYWQHQREWIGSRIQWDEFDIVDEAKGLNDLTLHDLIKIGATAGAQDFMTVAFEHNMDGKKLTRCINSGVGTGRSMLATGRDILLDEWYRVVEVLENMKVSMDCIPNRRYENNKFINSMEQSQEKSDRIQKGAGVFGKFGKKYGELGGDCGGWEAECAEIGRERGGRKKGGKNVLNVTNRY